MNNKRKKMKAQHAKPVCKSCFVCGTHDRKKPEPSERRANLNASEQLAEGASALTCGNETLCSACLGNMMLNEEGT